MKYIGQFYNVAFSRFRHITLAEKKGFEPQVFILLCAVMCYEFCPVCYFGMSLRVMCYVSECCVICDICFVLFCVTCCVLSTMPQTAMCCYMLRVAYYVLCV